MGDAEFARPENEGPQKIHWLKMQDHL